MHENNILSSWKFNFEQNIQFAELANRIIVINWFYRLVGINLNWSLNGFSVVFSLIFKFLISHRFKIILLMEQNVIFDIRTLTNSHSYWSVEKTSIRRIYLWRKRWEKRSSEEKNALRCNNKSNSTSCNNKA